MFISLKTPYVIARAGLSLAKFFLKLYDLNSADGIKLFAIKNMLTHRIKLTTNKLLIDLKRDKPEDFIAASSYCSERFPKVIMEAKRTVRGITKGKSLGE